MVPTLSSGDVVVMDNLGSHKGKGVRLLIRAAGAKLFFLPRYSPDLNRIEQVFAKLKTLLRKTDPRTIKTTWRGIGDLIDRFTPTGMRQFPRQCRICFSLTGSRSSCPEWGAATSKVPPPERQPSRVQRTYQRCSPFMLRPRSRTLRALSSSDPSCTDSRRRRRRAADRSTTCRATRLPCAGRCRCC